jgi:serine/threonine protein kinase
VPGVPETGKADTRRPAGSEMTESLIAGRYRLDSLIGRGGMSEVWCATDVDLDRRVALKLLAPNADIARFEREARAFAALAHPNVTRLYDYGEAKGRPFIVLEYLPGGTLEERLRAGALPDEQTRRIAEDVAAGLAHAHARGVVHRDLKPSNILFDEEGRAKLADFGIARIAFAESTLTEAGSVLGTAAYISPEQAAGGPATPASDVYSFGVLLYRMLTGRLPFQSDDPIELMVRHRDERPPSVVDVRADAPLELAATAETALATDPRLRPHDGAALLDAVTSGTAGLGAPDAVAWADMTPTTVDPGRPPRRRRIGAGLALTALLLLAMAGGVLAYEVGRPASGAPSPRLSPSTSTNPKARSQSPTSTTALSTATTALATSTATSTTVPTSTRHPTTTRPMTTSSATTALPSATTGTAPTTTDTTQTTTDTAPTTTDTTQTTTVAMTTAVVTTFQGGFR